METLDERADTLLRSALERVSGGAWADAARTLEAAAALHARAGRREDEAQCLQLAATLARASGGVGAPLAARAAAAPAGGPLAVSVAAERAETAFGERRHDDAVVAWTATLDAGRAAGLGADGTSAVLLRRAASLVALGGLGDAAEDVAESFRLLDEGSGPERAPFVLVEHARLLLRHGHVRDAARVVAALDAPLARWPADFHLHAEVHVLRARLARLGGEVDRAVDLALEGRDAALRAVAPVSYLAAAVELAEALESREDRADAYGALATAWVTLADLLGADVGRSWVEPCLVAYQLRWGREVFQEAKRRYEARRRTVTSR
jgi:hypothetical protein